MSVTLNTNIGQVLSGTMLTSHSSKINKDVISISTGQKFNFAGDYVSGGAKANKFMVQTDAYKNNLMQIRDGISLANSAEDALRSSENLLQKIRELAVQSSNGTFKTRYGDSEYSRAVGHFDITGGTPPAFASGTLRINSATDGFFAFGNLSITGSTDGTNASGTLSITGATNGDFSTASFDVTGGSSGANNKIDSISVNGVQINSSAIYHNGSNNSTAILIRNAINSSSTSPNYTATVSGNTVNISSADRSSSSNGFNISISSSGNVSTGNVSNFSGGVDPSQNTINSVTVNGVQVNSSSINVTGGNNDIALAIVNSINSNTSTPNYTASRSGSNVVITAATKNTSHNGYVISMNSSGDASASNSSLSGGATTSNTIIDQVRVNGVKINDNSINVTGGNSTVATAVANEINNSTSSPNYTAFASGSNVRITAVTKNTGHNGYSLTMNTLSGDATASNTSLAGGLSTSVNSISSVSVNGVQINDNTINVTGGNSTTASAIATAINNSTSSPNFTATSSGNLITITSTQQNSGQNGHVIDMNVSSGDATKGTVTNLSGGDSPTDSQVLSVNVAGTKINSNNINYLSNNATTAAAVAADINASTTNRNFTANAVGSRVFINSASKPFWADNNSVVTVTTKGDVTTGNETNLTGSVRISGGALTFINNEIKGFLDEYDQNLLNASFNTQKIFLGDTFSFQTGDVNNSTTISSPNYTHTALDRDTLDLTVNTANTSITYIDNEINNINNIRSQYSAFSNRLQSEIDFLGLSIVNNTDTLSKMKDTDIARSMANMTKNKLLETAARSVYFHSKLNTRYALDIIKKDNMFESESFKRFF